MVDADKNENTSSSTSGNADQSKGNDVLNTRLAEVQEQLSRMNAQMEATQNALAEANRRNTPPPKEEDDNIYDPKVLKRSIEASFNDRLRAERQKDMTIYNLAQEYPEIQTDEKIRKGVLESLKTIPEAMRDTADGYEMAVLKTVAKAGIMPKSKRQTVDDDTSISPRGGSSRPPAKRNKVSAETLAVAELLGRDISDPAVLKGLEEAANRETYTKYR